MGDLCASYPEYASLRVLDKEWKLHETVEKLEDALRDDWWCVARRVLPYSEGSASTVNEVYVLIRKPYGWANFVADASGKIVYKGRGRRKELVFNSQAHRSRDVRKFVILDIPPVKAFYLRHNNQSFRAYRYSVELHIDRDTPNKLDLHEYLQEHIAEVHPTVMPAYLARLVAMIKAGHEGLGGVYAAMTQEFKREVVGFKILQAREHEEIVRMAALREAEVEAAAPGVAVAYEGVGGTATTATTTTTAVASALLLPESRGGASRSHAAATGSSENLVDFSAAPSRPPGADVGTHHDLMQHMLGRISPSLPPAPNAADSAALPIPRPRSAASISSGTGWVQFEPEPSERERRRSDILEIFGDA